MTSVGEVEGRPRALKEGVYTPVPSFFFASEDLDLATFKKHIAQTASAGVGIVVAGSLGEARHLDPKERCVLTRAARQALDDAGLPKAPVIACTALAGARVTIALTRADAVADADAAIVVCPEYFTSSLTGSKKAQKKFFIDVADASPISIIVHNYPAATGGFDIAHLRKRRQTYSDCCNYINS